MMFQFGLPYIVQELQPLSLTHDSDDNKYTFFSRRIRNVSPDLSNELINKLAAPPASFIDLETGFLKEDPRVTAWRQIPGLADLAIQSMDMLVTYLTSISLKRA